LKMMKNEPPEVNIDGGMVILSSELVPKVLIARFLISCTNLAGV